MKCKRSELDYLIYNDPVGYAELILKQMPDQTSTIISKVWGMCTPLRNNSVSYGDCLEQLTHLIFLKMSDEYSRPPYKREIGIPAGYTWTDTNTLKGAERLFCESWKATVGNTRLR